MEIIHRVYFRNDGLDMALREDESPKPTYDSTEAKRAHYEKWERSNRLSLISIKRSIAEHLLG